MGLANGFFDDGLLTTVMDGQFGSSGKGKLSSWLIENSDNVQFACCAFGTQSGHTVNLDDGRTFFYQQLPSVAYSDKLEHLFIGSGAIIEVPTLLREIEENGLTPERLSIAPLAMILTEPDAEFERGECGFDGTALTVRHDGTMKSGSTAHGVGSATARKVLRRQSVSTARDIDALKPFVRDVSADIMKRLDSGQRGLLEIAQGFPLSLNGRFFPHCTSRNVTVAQALSDMFLPPRVAGDVFLNLRTFPIRINSKKFIAPDGRHLTWDEVQAGAEHVVYEGDSGDWYPDQHEVTWDFVTQFSGSPDPIMEVTSVTKLPRRVATFSLENVIEAITYNSTQNPTWLCVNFANYVDHSVTGARDPNDISLKLKGWLEENLGNEVVKLALIGTGPLTGDMIAHPELMMHGIIRR